MKAATNRTHLVTALCAVGLALDVGLAAQAASFNWDADPATGGQQNGNGSWNTTSNNWYNGINQAWNNAGNDTAVLPGGGGPFNYVITITEPVTIGGLQTTTFYGSHTLAASGTGALDLGLASTVITNGYTTGWGLTISAPISGLGAVFNGQGFMLSGSNTFTGAAVVNTTVSLGNYYALGDPATGTTINSGGSVYIHNVIATPGTVPEPFTLNGGSLANGAVAAVTASGLVTVVANSAILTPNIGGRNFTLSGGITNTGVNLTIQALGGGDTITVNSPLSGSGTVTLGAGEIHFSGVTEFGGTIAVTNGRLWLDSNSAISNATTRVDGGTTLMATAPNPAAASVILNGGTYLTWTGNAVTSTAPFTLTASSTIAGHGFGNNFTLTNNTISLGGNTLTLLNATFNPGVGSMFEYDKITGVGNVVMGNGSDNGTFWWYNTANDYTGSTTITSGRILPQANGVIPFNSDVIVNSQNSQALDLFNNLALTIGSLGGTGNVNTETSGKLTTGYNNNSTGFGGKITGSGSLVKIGTGTQILSRTNTYSGTTTISNGALQVDGLLSNASSAVTVLGGGTLSGSGTVNRPVTLNGGGTLASASTLTIGSNLTVIGLGNVISNGTISTPGDTINAGASLAVNGTLGGSGSVTVNGTLLGSGIVAKPVSVIGGAVLSPGNSPGTITIGSLSLASNATFLVEVLNTNSYDSVNVNGTVTLALGAILSVTNLPGLSLTNGDVLTIVNNDGTDPVSGQFTGYSQGLEFGYNPSGTLGYKIVYNTGVGGNDVVLIAVPEPSVVWLLAAAGGLIKLLRRARG